MDAWVMALDLGFTLVLIAMYIRSNGIPYISVSGIVSLLGLARLISDNALIIGHECCNAGADVTVSLSQNDLIIVALVWSAFVSILFMESINRALMRNREK